MVILQHFHRSGLFVRLDGIVVARYLLDKNGDRRKILTFKVVAAKKVRSSDETSAF